MNSPAEEPRVTEPIETPVQKNAPTGLAPPKHTLPTTIIIVAALAGVLIVLDAWELPPFLRSIQTTRRSKLRLI